MSGTPEIGDVIAEKYAIESVLGQGGMGTVFSARHVLTDRKVALKWMLPDTKHDPLGAERFLREARAMGRIDHPRVVGVMDVGQDGPATFIVMERLRGESLRARMARDEQLSPAVAVRLLVPALEGLAAAHRLGIVHRDLKPENLFIVKDGELESTKVLDFGISKFQVEPGDAASPMTQSGVTMGTPSYMSPEQVRGSRDVDARTDVWAIGVILHEMLTGHAPFRAESYGALLIAIATEAPTPLPDGVPEDLRAIVERALDKDPERRFASVDALAEALLPFGGSGITFRATDAQSIAPPPMTVAPITPGASSDTSSPTRGVLPAHLAATRAAGGPRRAPVQPSSGLDDDEPVSVPRSPPVWPVLLALVAIGIVTALALGYGLQGGESELAPIAIERPTESVVAPVEPAGVPPAEATTAERALAPETEREAAMEAPSDPPHEPETEHAARRRPRPPEAPAAPDIETPEIRGRSGALTRDDF